MMLSLSVLLLLLASAWAQESTQCSDSIYEDQFALEQEEVITVSPGIRDDSCVFGGDHFLVAKTIHWYIFTIGDDETPRVSMTPKGIVEPYVESRQLKFRAQEDALMNYTSGDAIVAGVSIFVKASQLEVVDFGCVDNILAINHDGTQPLTVKSSGVDNRLYITSPNAAVACSVSGVDSQVQIEAGAGSSVDVEGVDSSVEISVPDDQLVVKLSGADASITIEGNYKEIHTSGVDARVFVNGETGCNAYTSTGIDSSCSLTTNNVTVDALSCLADTKVANQDHSCFFANRALRIGVGIGCGILAVSIIALLVYCCCKCCSCCCCESASTKIKTVEQSKQAAFDVEQPVYVDAEVGGYSVEGNNKKVRNGDNQTVVTTAVELHKVVVN